MWHGASLGGWWMIVPGAVVIFGVIWLMQLGIRWRVRESHPDKTQATEEPAASRLSAIDVLEKLYARGELTKWEFERMKRDLSD